MPSLVGSEMCIRDSSIYSRPWIKNVSGEIPVTVTLKGQWKVAETPYCKVLSADKNQTVPVSYTHLRAHETRHDLVCRLLLEKKKKIREPHFLKILC